MKNVNIQEKQILVDNLNINYKIIGDGNIPIILLHGWGVSSDKYLDLAKYLSRFSIFNFQFSIIIPDLPGFGKSDNPPEAWGVDEYAELVKKFMKLSLRATGWSVAIPYSSALSAGLLRRSAPRNDRIILIGHSFGGRIAIKFAVKYQEQLKALILTGAAGIKHPLTIKQKIFYILARAGKIIFSLPIINKLEKSAQKLLYKAAQEKDYYEARGIMKETFKKAIAEDLSDYLEKIKIPTLLVWGAKDNSTPLADGKFMHFKIKNSKLKILDDSDHRAPYQYPEKFAKIAIEFIKKMDELY